MHMRLRFIGKERIENNLKRNNVYDGFVIEESIYTYVILYVDGEKFPSIFKFKEDFNKWFEIV